MDDESQNDEQRLNSSMSVRFTIGLLLVVMTVIAAFGTSLSYYARAVRAVWDKDVVTEIGVFAIICAMIPTVFMVVASWFIMIASWFMNIIKSSPNR